MNQVTWCRLAFFVALVAATVPPSSAAQPVVGKVRLEATTCWFEAGIGWPDHECYYVFVPENHATPAGREIAFPLLIYRSFKPIAGLAPVLHLGGGGPGAPVYLDYENGARALWANHDEISLNQGRDLYIIDPRGAGLAKPLLTCLSYVQHVLGRWRENLDLEQQWRAADENYFECVDSQRNDVDFSAYNSLAIARDVEWLRHTLGIERWVLIGVSYATIYAQNIVREYPARVEALILDSATFPNLHGGDNFIAKTMAPFDALFGYCDVSPACNQPLERLEERLWRLVFELDVNPIIVEVRHPYEGDDVEVLINGHRLIDSLIDGTYGEDIFRALPAIITELEKRETTSLKPFVEGYLSYLLDTTYGDVSAMSHYCYEVKPFVDIARMQQLVAELPVGFIQDYAQLSLEWPDFCDALEIAPGEPRLGEALQTDVPTLFLHGEHDPVTRLADVRSQLPNFRAGKVVTFPLSHDVLSSAQCAESIAAKFVDDPFIDDSALTCR